MTNASPSGQNQGDIGVGNFIVYADLSCPFCYALNESLHEMNLQDRVEFRSVQRAPEASSAKAGLKTLVGLTRDVAELRRRAPSVQIAVPLFRPDSAPASRLLDAVVKTTPARASLLRRRIFRALWVDGRDISCPQVLESLLGELDIDKSAMDTVASNSLPGWQQQWNDEAEFEHSVPVVISEQGEKVIGYPLESELKAFLKSGTLVSNEVAHDAGEHKPLQRILVLDNDLPALQMIIEQMSNIQIEIVEDFASLVEAGLERGMPDLVMANTALIEDRESTEWWRHSGDTDLAGALPVIFLSEDKSTEAEVAAFEAGAADFIVKPFHPRVLRARMNMHLQARESQRLLNNIARVDGLTAICNRREFDLRLLSEWSRGVRTGKPLALLMIDVDKFKQYNDHHGHLRGDKCLIDVAQLLNDCTQRTSDLIARYGGEEFVALLPDSDIEGAMTVAEDCLAALNDAGMPHLNSDVAPHVTVSIGVAAMVPVHDKSSTLLIEQADVALYQAKQNGRNRICSFTEWS